MSLPSPGHEPASERATDLASVPTDAWFTTWIAGTLIPAIIALYGVSAVIARHAKTLNLRHFKFPLSQQESLWLEFSGREGVMIGLFAVFAAMAMHFNWFWRSHSKLVYFYDPLRYLAAALAVAMFLAFGVSLMIW